MLKIKRFSNTDIHEVTSLKDFQQSDVHMFMNYGGKEMYDKCEYSSLGRGGTISNLKRGKYTAGDVKKYISGTQIIFPANDMTYNAKDFVFLGSGHDKFFDIVVDINSGMIMFPETPYYTALCGILPKYHTPKSTWEFRFVQQGYYNPPFPVLSVPRNKEDWEEIVKVFTEWAVFLKLFVGCYFKIFIQESQNPREYQKYYSDINVKNVLFQTLPSLATLGYKLIWYPKIMGKVSDKITKSVKKTHKPGLQKKIVDYCFKTYKDIYFVNLGTGSCFLNPQYIEDLRPIEEIGDPKRLRSMADWILKAREDKRYLVFYSDLDPAYAILHEVGHYLNDKDGVSRAIQKGNKKGIFSEAFIKFSSFVLGAALKTPGEILGILSSLLLKSPLVISEYQASWRGLKILKEDIKCSEEDYEEAKGFFKDALNSYLVSATKNVTSGTVGKISRYGFDSYMKLNT